MKFVAMVTAFFLMKSRISEAGQTDVHHTKGTPKDRITFEKDVSCDRRFLFQVKACKNACVAIKNKHDKTTIRLELAEGTEGSFARLTVILASKSPKVSTAKLDVLSCKKFVSFWMSWGKAGVSLGTGLLVSRNEKLFVPVPVEMDQIVVAIFTFKNNPGVWRIVNDVAPVFVIPPPSSATQIDVPENMPLGKIIYHVEARDPDDRITYDVIGNETEIFKMKKTGIMLTRALDYESRQMYGVVIRAQAGLLEVNATLLVNVLNVHDEPPVINVSRRQTVVEELPIGEIIPGIFTVTEKEKGGGLNYRLFGEHKQYVGINTFTGDLIMVDRLDYENVTCPRVLDLLTLEVENVVGHKSRSNLSIKVININDNVPKFDETIYKVKVKELEDLGKPLLTIHCNDPDKENNDNITVAIKEPSLSELFTITRNVMTFELNYDPGNSSFDDLDDKMTLTLEAMDSNTVIVHTATARVDIDMTAVSNATPDWVYPIRDNSTEAYELNIPEDYPPNVTIIHFNATWSGEIVYSILSVVSDENITVTNLFTIDKSTGAFQATKVLDCDPMTGGSVNYTVVVRATSKDVPSKFSDFTLCLFIDDVDDNVPIFEEGFYYALSGCKKDEEVILLTFNVTDYDLTSYLTLEMAENASKYTWLDGDNRTLVLKPSPGGTLKRWDTYEVLEVTAYDVNDGRLNATTYVMVYYENCSPAAQRRKRLRQGGASLLPKPSSGCEVKHYVKDKSVEDYIFKATSGILGLILICIAAFYLSKKTVFKSSPTVNPLEEPNDDPDDFDKETGRQSPRATSPVNTVDRSWQRRASVRR